MGETKAVVKRLFEVVSSQGCRFVGAPAQEKFFDSFLQERMPRGERRKKKHIYKIEKTLRVKIVRPLFVYVWIVSAFEEIVD